ncbi:hypothetical protein [Sulfurisoma sediminicola]|uniref:DUF1772 domain-containing protein n=1 Tax=Sulfurisoma sediminicola TaxID=1381557 RepID=A0A497XJP4_9PROT|nr:hypothetical protein [Sulfurisoma sediminicola]RLJ67580.1 hypothetical protein DFR35_0127 [Sulfurisoma sediminicola]
MTNLQEAIFLLQYTAQNIAMFSGGLFAGAAIYISLTECPPRTSLTPDGLLALYRSIARRTNGLLTAFAAVTALTAIPAAIAGAGILWLIGGVTHAGIVAFLLTNAKRIETELDHLDARADSAGKSKRLIHQRSLQFGILSLAGLFAQYLFVVGR